MVVLFVNSVNIWDKLRHMHEDMSNVTKWTQRISGYALYNGPDYFTIRVFYFISHVLEKNILQKHDPVAKRGKNNVKILYLELGDEHQNDLKVKGYVYIFCSYPSFWGNQESFCQWCQVM